MTIENFGGKENIKDFNKEVRLEILENYKMFQDFYGAIMERVERNPGLPLDGRYVNYVQVIDHLASEMHEVKSVIDSYGDSIPSEEVNKILSISQRIMNKAQGFYHGEYKLLDNNGKWLENVEYIENN